MSIFLPLAVFYLLYSGLSQSSIFSRLITRREGFLQAAIIWGTLIVFSTELLSLFRLFNRSILLIFWTLTFFVTLIFWLRMASGQNPAIRHKATFTLFDRWILTVLSGILLICALVAGIAAPNTWDSMTYHLPRVMHWIQNQSVANYPTHNTRQLFLSPWAEFTMSHFQLLSDSDRFANLVQWFSMVGAALGVSFIARQLGANNRGQIFAAAFSLTIPMGILQATSTQNDYVAAFWLVCVTYNIIAALKSGLTQKRLVFIAAACGLALFTKGTANLGVAPLLFWLFLSEYRRRKWQVRRPLLIGILIVLSLNSGAYLRNIDYNGFPLGKIQRYPNRDYGPRLLMSNVLRNLALHGATPFSAINQWQESALIEIHEWMGISPNHPAITYDNTHFAIPSVLPYESSYWAEDLWLSLRHEDHAGNFLHLLLMLAISLAIIRKRHSMPMVFQLWLVVVSQFLLFCLMFRWQPWHPRLHLPMFVLFSPLAGVVLGELCRKGLANASILLLLFASLPWLLGNTIRPLWGKYSILTAPRVEQYLCNKPDLRPHYEAASKFIENNRFKEIGLYMIGNAGEYPLWKYLEESIGKEFRLRHVAVNNDSGKKSLQAPHRDFLPEVIVSLHRQEEQLEIKGKRFELLWSSGPVKLLGPAGNQLQ